MKSRNIERRKVKSVEIIRRDVNLNQNDMQKIQLITGRSKNSISSYVQTKLHSN